MIASEVIPKKQTSGLGTQALGYKGFVSNQNFHLLYNDHPKNKSEYHAGDLKTMKRKYIFMEGKYDLETGEFSKSVFRKDGRDFSFNPSEVKNVVESKFLIMDKSEKPRLIEIIYR